MITDILTYVDSYENIRSACGLNSMELKDSQLALVLYRNRLNYALTDISGVYAPETESENLVEILARPLAASDPLYGWIQLYAIYSVADAVLDTIGLAAFKTQADGKASLTRFSSESTFRNTRRDVLGALDKSRRKINELLGNSSLELEILKKAEPDIDPITGV